MVFYPPSPLIIKRDTSSDYWNYCIKVQGNHIVTQPSASLVFVDDAYNAWRFSGIRR